MKFGTGQIGKPTPQRMVLLFDLLTVTFGIIAGFLTGAEFINHKFSDPAVITINLLLIPLCQAFKRMFGAEIDTKKVPVEQVTAVDDTKT